LYQHTTWAGGAIDDIDGLVRFVPVGFGARRAAEGTIGTICTCLVVQFGSGSRCGLVYSAIDDIDRKGLWRGRSISMALLVRVVPVWSVCADCFTL
jgi:hypothetical protein